MNLLEACRRFGQQARNVAPPSDLDPRVGAVVEALPFLARHELELWWYAVPLVVFGAGNMLEAQRGYEGPGWSDAWFVFAQASGDPIFHRRATGDVATAIAGVGRWSPVVMAPDLASWERGLLAWVELTFGYFPGTPFGPDSQLATGFEEQLLARLEPIVGSCARAWLPI